MADIRVQAETWNALSNQDQDKLRGLIADAGLLKEGDQFVPVPTIDPQALHLDWKTICHIKCSAAHTAAIAACNAADFAPPAAAACIILASAAATKCHHDC